MEKDRGSRILAVVALVVAVAGLTVGFSALSSMLVIKSTASYKLNGEEFDVVFSSDDKEVKVEAVNPTTSGPTGVLTSAATIDNAGVNPTITGLNARFTEPGQSVTYTFYAANTGKKTAYLKSIMYENAASASAPKECKKVNDATNDDQVAQACNGITLTVKTGNVTTLGTRGEISGEQIAEGGFEKIEVTIAYAQDATAPNGDFTVEFGDVKLNYSETA